MIPRCVLAVVVVLGAGTFTTVGHAARARRRLRCVAPATTASQPRVADQACFAAFRGAEMQIQAGQLRAAKERFLACSQAVCAKFLQQQCAQRYSQLEPEIPSVIPLFNDADGEPRADVKVSVDGEPLASRIDGRAFPVDPGYHTFTFSADGGLVARQNLTILQGQRNRAIEVSLKSGGATTPQLAGLKSGDGAVRRPAPRSVASEGVAAERVETGRKARPLATRTQPRPEEPPALIETPSAPPPDAPQAPARSRVLTYTVGGVGVAGLAAGGLLTYWGRVDNDRLAQCSPTCPSGAVDHVRHLYLGANIAFGVGVAALAAATWIYFRDGSHHPQSSASGTRMDVRASASGAVAGLRGTF